MSSTHTEKYSRLQLIVGKVATPVAKKMFEKCVSSRNANPKDNSVDTFMDRNKRIILQKRPKPLVQRELYPNRPQVRDYKSWDLITFCFLLTNVCSLEQGIIDLLNRLKKIRNKLSHLNKPELDANTYSTHLRDLRDIFDNLLVQIDDRTFTEEIRERIRELDEDPLSVHDITQWNHQQNKYNEHSASVLTDISRGATKCLKKLDILLKRSDTKPSDPPRWEASMSGGIVDDFDGELKLLFSNVDPDKATSLLGEIFEGLLSESPGVLTGETKVYLKGAVRTAHQRMLEEGFKIVDSDAGCVLLRIKFASPTCFFLEKFIRMYFNGSLAKLFQPLRTEMRTYMEIADLDLNVVIYENEFWRMVENAVSELAKFIPGAQISDSEAYVGSVEDTLSETDTLLGTEVTGQGQVSENVLPLLALDTEGIGNATLSGDDMLSSTEVRTLHSLRSLEVTGQGQVSENVLPLPALDTEGIGNATLSGDYINLTEVRILHSLRSLEEITRESDIRETSRHQALQRKPHN